MTDHQYVSTACQHTLHDRCRKTCKFCDTPCQCDCHTEPVVLENEWHKRTGEGCSCGWVWPSLPENWTKDIAYKMHFEFVTHPGQYIGRNMTAFQQQSGNRGSGLS